MMNSSLENLIDNKDVPEILQASVIIGAYNEARRNKIKLSDVYSKLSQEFDLDEKQIKKVISQQKKQDKKLDVANRSLYQTSTQVLSSNNLANEITDEFNNLRLNYFLDKQSAISNIAEKYHVADRTISSVLNHSKKNGETVFSNKNVPGREILKNNKELLETVISNYNDLLINDNLTVNQAFDELGKLYSSYGLTKSDFKKTFNELDNKLFVSLSNKPKGTDKLSFDGRVNQVRTSFYELMDRGYKQSEALEILSNSTNVDKTSIRKIVNRDISSISLDEKNQIFVEYLALNKNGSRENKVKDIARKYNISSSKVRKIAESLDGSIIDDSYSGSLTRENISLENDGIKLKYTPRNSFDENFVYQAEQIMNNSTDNKNAINQFMDKFDVDSSLAKRYIRKAKSNIRKKETVSLEVLLKEETHPVINSKKTLSEYDSRIDDLIYKLDDMGGKYMFFSDILKDLQKVAYEKSNSGSSHANIRRAISRNYGGKNMLKRKKITSQDLPDELIDTLVQMATEDTAIKVGDEEKLSKKNKFSVNSIFEGIGRELYSQIEPFFVNRSPYVENQSQRFRSIGKKAVLGIAVAGSLTFAGLNQDNLKDMYSNVRSHIEKILD